jgi:DNA-binding NtrC family response regulator
LNVLIVESNRSVTDLWRYQLALSGANIWAESDYDTATKVIEREHLDVLILDTDINEVGALALADLVGFRQPEAQIIFVTPSQGEDSSALFALYPNARCCVPINTRPSDLAVMAEHYARAS